MGESVDIVKRLDRIIELLSIVHATSSLEKLRADIARLEKLPCVGHSKLIRQMGGIELGGNIHQLPEQFENIKKRVSILEQQLKTEQQYANIQKRVGILEQQLNMTTARIQSLEERTIKRGDSYAVLD